MDARETADRKPSATRNRHGLRLVPALSAEAREVEILLEGFQVKPADVRAALQIIKVVHGHSGMTEKDFLKILGEIETRGHILEL